jgi:alkylation response protein AidB-like acyl-CoA dehydrogenase
MAKLFCSVTAMKVSVDALQLHGGSDFPIERTMRDAKITQIYEGANEIQKLIIAKYVYARQKYRPTLHVDGDQPTHEDSDMPGST